jgi:hypothetical protein
MALGTEGSMRLAHRLSFDSPLPYGLRDDTASRLDMVRLTPDFQGRKGKIVYRTNHDGWRDDEIDPTRRHVVCLGDSCTFGVGVNHEDTWPEQLEQRLGENWQAVNTSTPGQGTTDQERLLMQLRPDRRLRIEAVIVGFFFNDPGECRATAETESRSKHSFLRRFRTLRFLKSALGGNTGSYSQEVIDSGEPLCYAALSRIASLYPTLVLILPESDNDVLSPEERPWRQRLIQHLEQSKISYVNLKDVFSERLDGNAIPSDWYATLDTIERAKYRSVCHQGDIGHPGPGACRVIAEETAKWVTKK